MKQQNLTIMDPHSPYYRICPGCSVPHMVEHRGRDYCSNKCADNYYNWVKRNFRQAERIIADKGYITQESNEAALSLSQQVDPGKVYFENEFNKNVFFLENLKISDKDARYSLIYFLKNHFNFSVYSARQPVNNITENEQCFYIVIKNYSIFLLKENEILIQKIINQNAESGNI